MSSKEADTSCTVGNKDLESKSLDVDNITSRNRPSTTTATTATTLLDIVADAAERNNLNTNMNLTTSSHSMMSSSAGDTTSGDDHTSIEFPDLRLRRTGTYPLPSEPPRRPNRSTSLERSESLRSLSQESSSEDEIDRQKFRQLLLGNSSPEAEGAGSMGRASSEGGLATNDEIDSTAYTASNNSGAMIRSSYVLRHRKSSCSAPPKIPNRIGSDSEEVATSGRAASTRTATRSTPSLPSNPPRRRIQRHRQSLSSTAAVFRPLPVHRRRQRALSLKMPPRLPSRSNSDKSADAGLPRLPATIPTELVLCNTSLAAASGADTASTSQKSTGSTDAPKRPRRSLSPVDGESIRSLLDPDAKDDDTVATKGIASSNPPQQNSSAKRAITSSATTDFNALVEGNTSARKRQLPKRARTFDESCITAMQPTTRMAVDSNFTSIVAAAAKTSSWDHGDWTGVAAPCNSPDSKDSMWTAKTWPKPRRQRVLPGRSRTFSFFCNQQLPMPTLSR